MKQPPPLFSEIPGLESTKPPRASRFIVTLYGDVVEPRGGALWMSALIECCAAQGISESLVRTAVSRLVASGHLEGERIGRKSLYQLTAPARQEFAQAAKLFYASHPAPERWLIALNQDAAPGHRWAQFGPRSFVASQVPDDPPPGGIVLLADHLPGSDNLQPIAEQYWKLSEVAAQYSAFLDLFRPLSHPRGAASDLSPEQALAARLQLVHRYRQIVLRDPRLPKGALPPDWPGFEARRMFAQVYLDLADSADCFVAQTLADKTGKLALSTSAVKSRLKSLSQII